MAQNVPQINPANQGTLRHSIAVDEITTGYKSWTSASIGGVDWTMSARRETDDGDVEKLGVYLDSDTVKRNAEAEIRASYVVRLLGVEPINMAENATFTKNEATWGNLLATWSDVKNPAFGFCVDGRINVEIDVTVEEVKFLPPAIDAMGGRGVCLDDMEFADMRVKVKGEDWEGILCHKAVMCRHSEAIHGAMTNASTTEAKSGDFAIGDQCASKEGVEQFVRLNYKKWKEETMDQYAIELFVLGEVLLCRRVKVLATLAIKRLLSVATFWPTLKAAVRIDDKYIVRLCASFANETPQRLWDLVNQEDGKEVIEQKDKEGTAAFLVLVQAISEMNKN